jgi:hypothetical protein
MRAASERLALLVEHEGANRGGEYRERQHRCVSVRRTTP